MEGGTRAVGCVGDCSAGTSAGDVVALGTAGRYGKSPLRTARCDGICVAQEQQRGYGTKNTHTQTHTHTHTHTQYRQRRATQAPASNQTYRGVEVRGRRHASASRERAVRHKAGRAGARGDGGRRRAADAVWRCRGQRRRRRCRPRPQRHARHRVSLQRRASKRSGRRLAVRLRVAVLRRFGGMQAIIHAAGLTALVAHAAGDMTRTRAGARSRDTRLDRHRRQRQSRHDGARLRRRHDGGAHAGAAREPRDVARRRRGSCRRRGRHCTGRHGRRRGVHGRRQAKVSPRRLRDRYVAASRLHCRRQQQTALASCFCGFVAGFPVLAVESMHLKSPGRRGSSHTRAPHTQSSDGSLRTVSLRMVPGSTHRTFTSQHVGMARGTFSGCTPGAAHARDTHTGA
jgi:hypothetical protein